MQTYKVRSVAGLDYDVDEDRLPDAEKDGYLPVVSDGKVEHRVAVADLPRAAQDGFRPAGAEAASPPERSIMDRVGATDVGAALTQAGRNVPVVGPAAVKLGHAFRAGMGALTGSDAGAAIPGGGQGHSYGELYDKLEADDAAEQGVLKKTHPVGMAGAELLGSVGAPVPGAGIKGVAGAAARVGSQAAIAGGDAALRGRDVEQAAELTGAVAAGAESLPLVGKAAAALTRLLPGTSKAVVNKLAARLAALMPGQQATAEELERVFANPELRRAAASTDLAAEAGKLAPELANARKSVNKATGDVFQEAEKRSLAAHEPTDDMLGLAVQRDVTAASEKIAENADFYGPLVKKAYNDVETILSTGGPREAGAATAPYSKERLLRARRRVDELTKKKDFADMLSDERDAILSLRDMLDEPLKNGMSGAAERAEADALYRSKASADRNFFDPLTSKNPDKSRVLDAAKLERSLKSNTQKGSQFDERLDTVRRYLDDNPSLGELPDVRAALKKASELRDVGSMTGLMERLKRATGGPSSQAINMAAQTGAAAATSGLSMLALPVTNPVAYLRLLDNAAAAGDRLARYAPVLKAAYEKRGPAALAAAHAALLSQDSEYKAAFEAAAK